MPRRSSTGHGLAFLDRNKFQETAKMPIKKPRPPVPRHTRPRTTTTTASHPPPRRPSSNFKSDSGFSYRLHFFLLCLRDEHRQRVQEVQPRPPCSSVCAQIPIEKVDPNCAQIQIERVDPDYDQIEMADNQIERLDPSQRI